MPVVVPLPEPGPIVRTDIHRDSISGTRIDDIDLGRILFHGALFGLPLAYVVTFLIALPAAGPAIAGVVSIWPAIVAGPWLGATLLMGKRSRELQAHPRSPEMPTSTPAPTTSAPIGPTVRAA